MKKKILVFAHESGFNGASQSLLTLLLGIRRWWEALVIVPASGIFSSRLAAANIPFRVLATDRCGDITRLPFKTWAKKTANLSSGIKTKQHKLEVLLKGIEPDLVYTNTSTVDAGYYYAARIGRPHIWHIREYGNRGLQLYYFPFRHWVQRLIKKSHTAVFPTKLLKDHWVGEKADNARVVFNGFCDATVTPVKKSLLTEDGIAIGVVGMIADFKGQLEAVRIANELSKRNRNIHLYIYGNIHDQSYYEKIVSYINENGLANKVTFAGFCSSHQELYSQLHVLLNCSVYEGFGRTIIEGMAFGLPVIARRSGGPSELIENGRSGFLYEDTGEAVAALETLMDNRELFMKISERGRKQAIHRFSKAGYIEQMMQIFDSA